MRKHNGIMMLIILLTFIASYIFYPYMPDSMASHWNAQGEVDGYMPKFWGLFLMPFISMGVLFLFLFIPRLDPLKENIEKFRIYFDSYILVIIFFLFYLHLLTILWNFNILFNMNQALPPAFGIVLYYTGIVLGKAQRNWFIGIRTPWTLSSDIVWHKTHAVGSKLFKFAGAIALLGFFFPAYSIVFLLMPVLFTSLYTVIYSFFSYRREIRAG